MTDLNLNLHKKWQLVYWMFHSTVRNQNWRQATFQILNNPTSNPELYCYWFYSNPTEQYWGNDVITCKRTLCGVWSCTQSSPHSPLNSAQCWILEKSIRYKLCRMLSHVVQCCVISRNAFSLFAFHLKEAANTPFVAPCSVFSKPTGQAASQNTLLLCTVRKLSHFSAHLIYSFLITLIESANPFLRIS